MQQQNAIGWTHPLVLAIFAAAIAAFGNSVVALINGANQAQIEQRRSESTLVLEAIKVGTPEKASKNLEFLLEAGMIENLEMKRHLGDYLHRKPTDFAYIAQFARERLPANLMTDCESANEPTVGDVLDNRYSVIICERIKNCALRDWSAGGPGICPANEIDAIAGVSAKPVH